MLASQPMYLTEAEMAKWQTYEQSMTMAELQEFGRKHGGYTPTSWAFQQAKQTRNNQALLGAVAAVAILIFAPGALKVLAIPVWFLSPHSTL